MDRDSSLLANAWTKSRRATLVLAVVAGLTLGLVGPASATITPSSTALTIAQAIASSSVNVTSASFAAVPPNGTPNGVSNSALTGFPTDGANYGILTTGNVSSVDQPGTFASTVNAGPTVRGDTDLDVSILKIDLSIPSGVNCLSFDFRFLSEEYPVFVSTAFNDAFIAELDTSNWTTSGSDITAPNNFAFDSSNEVVSINSTGLGGMTAARGTATAYDGTTSNPNGDPNGAATVLLNAATPVTPGAHSLYLSLFDQGDQAYDSAVFLDNLRSGFVSNPGEECEPGASQPARLTLTKTVDNTGGGTAAATDWTLTATGPTTISGNTGDAAITNATVSPGTYTLSEDGPSGYSASAWNCTGGTLTGSSLVLAADATASCSISNTFVTSGSATYVSILLDRSGSMGRTRGQTIATYNLWLADQQAAEPEARATMALFSSCGYRRRGPAGQPITDLPMLTKATYKPACKTPLYDAIARAIKRAAKNPLSDGNVVIVVYTDGIENASINWTLEEVDGLIANKVAAGWTFVWLGDSPDPLIQEWAGR